MIFTDFFDDWTGEDFSEFIYNDDYVKVDPEYTGQRGRNNALFFSDLLAEDKSVSILDYGSGNGSFIRAMQQSGFEHVSGYDPFSNPQRPQEQSDIVLAFEVVEHSPRPAETLDDIVRFIKPGGFALISQVMIPAGIDSLKADWWYMGPRNGHISFFTYDTIIRYARSRDIS
ncbi:class I SAM-dependent methyltransferase [Acetobacter sp. AN02]|uniref:class I SAM-dependent methyltransferase n=1 Tax=Acetobacter sp. AN02 TaxID=2894186 RepID=UPI002434345C|nr:class I SAM-dependent methyltransferase [Acetobacter sp. AN02]MDG6094685.1 class I SAM-dependent methyltransferase [Acetobacter sp. AN02]